MKKSNIAVAVFIVLIAAASYAKATDFEIDFDGRTSKAVSLEEIKKGVLGLNATFPVPALTV